MINTVKKQKRSHFIVFTGGLSSTSLVAVYVEDVNDNAPIFYPSVYNVSLRQKSHRGVPVVVVSAVDSDSGSYGSVTYRIASGDDHHSFRMESKKGRHIFSFL